MSRRPGTLVQRGERKWLIRVDLGRDTDGKRHRVSRTIHGTKKDAERALREMLRQRDLGALVETSHKPLSEHLDEWLEQVAAPRVAPRTLRDYEHHAERHLKPALGAAKLSQITPQRIQTLYTSMTAQGLSPRTVRYAHAVLRMALEQAVKWRMIAMNPATIVDLPKRAPSKVRALTASEAQRLLAAARGGSWGDYIALLLGTGLRPSEALALHWQDVDLGAGHLVVRRAVSAGEIREPKTARGRRRVTLPPELAQQLADRERRTELVFPGERGGLADLSAIRRQFKDVLQLAKIEGRVRLYDLRHTHATLLLIQNVHPKIVSERLGHSSIQITLDTYSHVLPTMQREGAEKIGEVLYRTPLEPAGKAVN